MSSRAISAATFLMAIFCTIPIQGGALSLRVVSSRADSVSGGNALVEVGLPPHSNWAVDLNGKDVTAAFRPAERSVLSVALLTGLLQGRNVLEVTIDGIRHSALTLVNHPRSGPTFSGPHQAPFRCETESNGLASTTDPDCDTPTIVRYYYKSKESIASSSSYESPAVSGAPSVRLSEGFKPYDPSMALPADMAQTVTADGKKVNYIVRWERGVVNRGVYDIRFLHQPGEPLPTPWTLQRGSWNGRLVYEFLGGCGVGYRQGVFASSDATRAQDLFVALGYAVASSTLNVLGYNCNDRVSAETMSMVKELFVEQYGEPVHTIGWGGSGGAVQQYLIVQNYPGLLDAIVAFQSAPDAASAAEIVVDWALLARAFESSTLHWSEAQKSAVSGLATWRVVERFYGDSLSEPKLVFANPSNCDTAFVPKVEMYDPDSKPDGIRCDLYTDQIHVLGRDPRTGLAYRPLDNVGVQYGLDALYERKINAAQFLELNERVGGYDEHGRYVPARMQAPPEAACLAYERGFVMTGGGGLGEVPILDWRWYVDDMLDGHDRVQSFVSRARLIEANGHANNQVLIVSPRVDALHIFGRADTESFVQRSQDLMRRMNAWLDQIAADFSAGTQSEKVVRNRPKDLGDGCIEINGEELFEPVEYKGVGRCDEIYPSHGTPRIAAGAAVAGVLKCQLKPIDPNDYANYLNRDQVERLKAIFPGGVCDYSRAGVGQKVTRLVWQRF